MPAVADAASLALTAYLAVLCAELAGDKTLFTLAALAARYAPRPVLAGAGLAFLCKMAAAVLLGELLTRLPPALTAAVSAVTFLALAIWLWREPAAEAAPGSPSPGGAHAMLAALGAVLATEWGDAGQLTAALLVARGGDPGVVWLGATLALATKAALAVTLGARLRRYLPRRRVRLAAVCVAAALGVLALLDDGEGDRAAELHNRPQAPSLE